MRLFNAGPAIGKLNHHFFSLHVGADPKQSPAHLLERVQRILDDLHERME